MHFSSFQLCFCSKLQTQADVHFLFSDENLDTSLDVDPYDAADVFKRYLRDLPETLLTESLCSSFSLIFSSAYKLVPQLEES